MTLTPEQAAALTAMGIERWTLRAPAEIAVAPPTPPVAAAPVVAAATVSAPAAALPATAEVPAAAATAEVPAAAAEVPAAAATAEVPAAAAAEVPAAAAAEVPAAAAEVPAASPAAPVPTAVTAAAPPPLDEPPLWDEVPAWLVAAEESAGDWAGGSWEPVRQPLPPKSPPLPRDWPGLERMVATCHRCAELAAQRTRTVFGVGDRESDWMVIGEAPGADEDRQGEPFVGRAGQLLDQMMLAIGLPRERIFIANILKCRPPRNRDPQPEEAAACRPYLDQQIALVQPRIILAVGRIAAQQLLATTTPIGQLRGECHTLPLQQRAIPVVVTYHPAYLLRSPLQKRQAWRDLQLARRIYREQGGGTHP